MSPNKYQGICCKNKKYFYPVSIYNNLCQRCGCLYMSRVIPVLYMGMNRFQISGWIIILDMRCWILHREINMDVTLQWYLIQSRGVMRPYLSGMRTNLHCSILKGWQKRIWIRKGADIRATKNSFALYSYRSGVKETIFIW